MKTITKTLITKTLIITTLIITTSIVSARVKSNIPIPCSPYSTYASSGPYTSGPYTIAESERMNMHKTRGSSVAIPFGYANDEWNVAKSMFEEGDEFYYVDYKVYETWELVRDCNPIYMQLLSITHFG